MSRREFTKKTKRTGLARSGMRCEAIGKMYNLDGGQRCNADLGKGVEYDHIILDANSKDNSLENLACVCIPCHRQKTSAHDIPMAAKTVRMQDKAHNIVRAKKKIPGQGFAKAQKPPRESKPNLPYRQLYRPEPQQ